MSQQSDPEFVTLEGAPAVEPFASIMEYAERLGSRHLWMLQQLGRLHERSDRWIVAGPARIEQWHVGAIVAGPPGFFLIWPKTTRTETRTMDHPAGVPRARAALSRRTVARVRGGRCFQPEP